MGGGRLRLLVQKLYNSRLAEILSQQLFEQALTNFSVIISQYVEFHGVVTTQTQ